MNRPDTFTANKVAHLEALCRDRGIPFTIQRRVIMENLAGRTDHPTADQVYEGVRDRLPGIARTTVYRVLETLVGLGVAVRISNPEAKARFDADCGRHHHVHCLSCGRVADLHRAALNDLPMPDGTPYGFEIFDYSVSFAGICASCRKAGTRA